MLNNINLSRVLFLDIETVPEKYNYKELNNNKKKIWEEKFGGEKDYPKSSMHAEFGKIICISVNDPNVMKAWGEIQKVENKIFMAADPYCEFTKALGAEIDRTERGLGMRSKRYTMMVEDNAVKIIKVEEDTAQCEISAAENFIEAI